ncbi:hypothetical protein BHE74_00022615 [Ensete ventricosum]|nr:hypothetical protein BHE74_00022615 [Ensete ventricosum]RZS12154.1 hypothetical protein BHM03_00043559 [Ensete ventricosum]
MDLSSLQSRASSSSSAGAYFPPHRTQLHPRLYYSPPPPAPRTTPCGGGDRRWILSAGLLILPFLFYLFAAAGRAHLSSHFDAPRPKGFGLVIDAGPSGSRIHVFEFLDEGRIPFVGFDGKGSVSMRVKPGLGAFAAAPEEAGESILKLLEFAKGRVPRAEWMTTKVQLIENGGLGSFPLRVRTAILESCKQVLRSSGFMFRDDWVSPITEPMLEWVKRRRIKRILYLMRREILNVLCLLLPRSTAWYALVYPSVCYTIPYRAKLGTLA